MLTPQLCRVLTIAVKKTFLSRQSIGTTPTVVRKYDILFPLTDIQYVNSETDTAGCGQPHQHRPTRGRAAPQPLGLVLRSSQGSEALKAGAGGVRVTRNSGQEPSFGISSLGQILLIYTLGIGSSNYLP